MKSTQPFSSSYASTFLNLIICFFIWSSATSCGSASRSSMAYGYNERYDADKKGSQAQTPIDWGKLIIYNASTTIKVKSADSTNNALNTIAQRYQGYIVSRSDNYTSIRVKAEFLEPALADIASLGKVLNKNVYSEDVTSRYTDLNIRLDNAEKARARYLELLAKAETVEATLLVEKELERLNTDIDLLKGQIREMDHNVAYSMINVSIEQKSKLGVLGYVFVGVYKGVRWLFVRG